MRRAKIADRFRTRYLDLFNEVGKVSLFYFCAVFDVPYIPELYCDDFDEYALKADEAVENYEVKGFRAGITDMREVLENVQSDFERWHNVWGIGDEDKPYTESDYRRLDELFKTYSSRLEKIGGMDAQQEDTLRVCSKMRLESDKALAKGGKENIDIASKLNKMIQDNLSSENLRKKDEKPVEEVRVDGIVDAIRKKYGVGVEMTYDEAVEICSKWMVSHHYPYTKDAAEEALLAIINCTRRNNDESEFIDMPKQLRFNESCTEFDIEASSMEKEAYKYLGIRKRKPPLADDNTEEEKE